MKYLLIVLIFFPLSSFTQNTLQVSEKREVYMEKVIEAPEFSKEELFTIALNWVSEAFVSPNDVISFSDLQIGKIKGNFVTDYHIGLATDAYRNTFTIYIKEGKIKIRFDGITEIKYGYSIETNILKGNNTFRGYSGLTADCQSTLNGLILNFEKSISDYTLSTDDW